MPLRISRANARDCTAHLDFLATEGDTAAAFKSAEAQCCAADGLRSRAAARCCRAQWATGHRGGALQDHAQLFAGTVLRMSNHQRQLCTATLQTNSDCKSGAQ